MAAPGSGAHGQSCASTATGARCDPAIGQGWRRFGAPARSRRRAPARPLSPSLEAVAGILGHSGPRARMMSGLSIAATGMSPMAGRMCCFIEASQSLAWRSDLHPARCGVWNSVAALRNTLTAFAGAAWARRSARRCSTGSTPSARSRRAAAASSRARLSEMSLAAPSPSAGACRRGSSGNARIWRSRCRRSG